MDGVRAISMTPSTASVANHTSITGPNSAPTLAVPRLWNRNSASSTKAASGIT